MASPPGARLWLWLCGLAAVCCALSVSSTTPREVSQDAAPDAAPAEPPAPPEVLAPAPAVARTAAVPIAAADSRPSAAAIPTAPAATPRTRSRPAEPEPTARLSVLVVDAGGRGVPHASLELRREEPDGAERVERLRCDAGGRWEAALPHGLLSLAAWSEDASQGPEWLELREPRSLELVLAPARRVRGTVRDASSGLPIAGARVSFWTAAETDVVRTGADGGFLHPRFPEGERAHQVRVEAQGYGSAVRYLEVAGDGRWALPPAHEGGLGQSGGGEPFLALELVPALALRGRVVDPGGRPVAGALVEAEGYFRVLPGVASPDRASAVSGEDGGFLVAGLRSDVGHALVARHGGLGETRLELPAEEGGETWVGDLVLGLEDALVGVVLDPAGEPVVDIVVEARAESPPAASAHALDVPARPETRTRAVRTDAHGVFRIEGLARGSYELRVLRDLEPFTQRTVHSADRAVREGLVLRLPPHALTLEGLVRDARGLVAGASVELRRYGRVGRVHTDERGRFRIAGLDDAADYELFACAPCPATGGLATARTAAFGAGEIELWLEPGER